MFCLQTPQVNSLITSYSLRALRNYIIYQLLIGHPECERKSSLTDPGYETSMTSLPAVTAFEHTPLNHTRTSIRLLKIRNELSDTGLVQCEMWHDTVETTYDCLSYAWGSEENEQNILINDQLFRVRKNLWNFLATARTKYAAAQRILWIDALSINQGSISEKNHQVRQMGLIYSKAVRVIAWLGMEKAIVRALVFCNDLGALRNNCFQECPSFDDIWTSWRQRDKELHGQLTQDFESFSGSPYWNRAWITQEILLARKVTIFANDYECCLDKTLYSHLSYSPWIHTQQTFLSYIEAVCGQRQTQRDTLADLLIKFPGRECMIPRDQIYSLVSVASDAYMMTIDYGSTFRKFLCQCLRTIEHSLCLCSWIAIIKTLNLRSRDYVHEYAELVFIVRMRLSKLSGSNYVCSLCQIRCQMPHGHSSDLPTCIQPVCRKFESHFVLRKHLSGTNTSFTLQSQSYGSKEVEVAYIEHEAASHSNASHSRGDDIKVYLKATELEKIIDHENPYLACVCRNAYEKRGCMSVYYGPPLCSNSQQLENIKEYSFVQDDTGALALQVEGTLSLVRFTTLSKANSVLADLLILSGSD